MNKTHLKITTLSQIFYEGDVVSVNLKTKSGGSISLQSNRSPFFSSIDICKLTINENEENNPKICSIGGGLVYADANNIKIITDDIIFGENIDIKRANEDKENAIAQLERYRNTKDEMRFELKLRKAINRINVYNNK